MRIAIIGAGQVGQTLGRRWAERGHAIVYGVREPEAPKSKDAATAAGQGPARSAARSRSTPRVVADLAKAIGFEAIDAGPLRIARLLEPFAMLWIHLALFRGMGTGIAFRLLRR
jgi:predicted dinucleotide-binding enzyme